MFRGLVLNTRELFAKMFKIFINDGKQPPPTDDIYYIICKEGIFLKKKVGIMESVVPVTEISILNSIKKTAKLHIDPIPKEQVVKIFNFFRQVYEKHKSEGNVLLFYDQEKKEHIPYVPKQEVGGASVQYNKAVQMEGCVMLGTIHSHANFSAFHSGVDDADEKTFDGLHITFGNVMDATPSISASIVSNGVRFPVDPEQYLTGVKKTKESVEQSKISIPTTKVYRMVDGKLVEDEEKSKSYSYSYTTGNKRFEIEATPEEMKKFVDNNWIKNVSKYEYKYDAKKYDYSKQYKYMYGGYEYNPIGRGYPKFSRAAHYPSQSYYDAFWDEMYDDWYDSKGNLRVTSKKPSDSKVDPVDKGNDFPAHVAGPSSSPGHSFDANPCEYCCHVDKKIEFVFELLQAKFPKLFESSAFDEDVEEDNDEKTIVNEDGEIIETYSCDPCKVMIEVAENELHSLFCPKCNKNDNLIVSLDEDEVLENMEKGYVLFKYPKPTFTLAQVLRGVTTEPYSKEDEIQKMMESDSGDIEQSTKEAFMEYVVKEIKEHKNNNKHNPFPSKFQRRSFYDSRFSTRGKNMKIPFMAGFSGAVVAPGAQHEKPEQPVVTVIKRDKNKK